MSEVDPVILEIRAEMGRYKAELKNTTALATASFARQERDVLRLEKQIRASSANISSTLRGLTGVFAGALSVQQVKVAIDSYTRFTNQLRVAGLEGEKLERTQQQLFEVAQRYGVELEVLGNLYGGVAQTSKDLGASQTQILALTAATSQALKITGVSAAQAGGAILGLTQSLASGVVRAEEFNQINEGGLRPLLAVVAANEKFGGSVAKLRNAVVAGKVTSQEFFQAILKGAGTLEGQAAKATLTLSGAMTKLANAFSVYIGQAAEANGATAAVAGGLELLATNLDTVADAIAVIAAVLLGRYVAGAIAASAATGVVSTALFAMQARAIGAATTMEALALTGAAAGRALLAAFGGPVGIAVTALALGIGYLATRNEEAAQAARVNAQAQQILGDSTKKASDAVEKLASAHGKARQEALKAAKAEYENTKQKLASAQASLMLASAEYARLRTDIQAGRGPGASAAYGAPGYAAGAVRTGTDQAAEKKVLEAVQAGESAVIQLMGSLERLRGAIAAPESAIPSVPDGKKKKGRHGRSAAEIQAEVDDKIRQFGEQELRARLDIATDIDKRAELQGEIYEREYQNQIAEIQANKEYSAAQKALLRAAIQRLHGRDGKGALTSDSPEGISINREVERQRRAQDERDLQMRREALEADADLVEGRAARLEIERRILDLAQQEEISRLEASIAAGEIADAEKARALLARKQSAGRENLLRQYETPLDRYRRSFNDPSDQVEEAVVSRLEQVDDAISDAITKRLGVKDPLIASLLDILIQQVLMKPIADALAGARGAGGGGVGGFLGSVVGSIFGRASGGYNAPHSVTRVNENRGGGVELLRMGSQGGHVIPLGQARASSGAGVTKIYQINVSADHSVTPAGFAQGLAESILKRAQQMDSATARATLGAVPRMLSQQNRYGG